MRLMQRLALNLHDIILLNHSFATIISTSPLDPHPCDIQVDCLTSERIECLFLSIFCDRKVPASGGSGLFIASVGQVCLLHFLPGMHIPHISLWQFSSLQFHHYQGITSVLFFLTVWFAIFFVLFYFILLS